MAVDEDGSYTASGPSVNVTSRPNQAPEAAGDAYEVNEDATLSGNVLANDSDGDGDELAAILVSSPSHGTLDLNPGGSFTYTPNRELQRQRQLHLQGNGRGP